MLFDKLDCAPELPGETGSVEGPERGNRQTCFAQRIGCILVAGVKQVVGPYRGIEARLTDRGNWCIGRDGPAQVPAQSLITLVAHAKSEEIRWRLRRALRPHAVIVPDFDDAFGRPEKGSHDPTQPSSILQIPGAFGIAPLLI